jgi:hypothetical protein
MNFNLKRFGLLIKNDLLVNKQIIFTSVATVAIVLFLYALIFANGVANFHPIAYLLLLFIGGFWTSSLAFKDLHDKQRNYIFLTLPCSNLEKFLSKLLLTSVGYVLCTLLGFYLLSLLVLAIDALLFHHGQAVFNPFRDNILFYLRDYIILQSVFFLGSVYFKSHAMTKTILALASLALIFILFTFLIVILFLGPYGLSLLHMFTTIFKSIFWLLLAPCCWFIAYIRLREAQV